METSQGMGRKEWFGCACCPSNICRFLSSVSGYMYAQTDEDVYVNLYASGEANMKIQNRDVTFTQQSEMPWDGKSTLKLGLDKSMQFKVYLRIPGWARNEANPGNELYTFKKKSDKKVTIKLNGKEQSYKLDKGYVVFDRKWKNGDEFELNFPVEIREVLCDERVKSNRDKVALQRGPIVYCSEGVDFNEPNILNLLMDETETIETKYDENLLGGIMTLEGKVHRVKRKKEGVEIVEDSFKAIPYYAWANRGLAPMQVWYATNPDAARPTPLQSIPTKSELKTSQTWSSKEAIRDQMLPAESNDFDFESMVFRRTRDGEPEQEFYTQYLFDKEYTISESTLYWMVRGDVRTPKELK
ncbi:MAG: glycoside hydrolase family 127 protein, partial [Bacteroidales bacterium]|nr:glycoside hydrolase family 127 protein [Bacteroidales bacterium]